MTSVLPIEGIIRDPKETWHNRTVHGARFANCKKRRSTFATRRCHKFAPQKQRPKDVNYSYRRALTSRRRD